MLANSVKHPAQFSAPVVQKIKEELGFTPGQLLDPFAGPGRKLHEFDIPGRTIVGVEIEKPWVDAGSEYVIQGDSTKLPTDWADRFDIIICSPAYGNRFSDSHKAKDQSVRRSYTHDLRNSLNDDDYELDANNTGRYPFFRQPYKDLHEKVWREVTRVAAKESRFLLNVSDFERTYKGVKTQIHVSTWHLTTLEHLGWNWVNAWKINTERYRYGANSNNRVEGEWLFDLRLSK